MADLSTFNNGDRLIQVGINDYMLDILGPLEKITDTQVKKFRVSPGTTDLISTDLDNSIVTGSDGNLYSLDTSEILTSNSAKIGQRWEYESDRETFILESVADGYTPDSNPLVDIRADRVKVVQQTRVPKSSTGFVFPASWTGPTTWPNGDPIQIAWSNNRWVVKRSGPSEFRSLCQVLPSHSGTLGDRTYWVSYTGSDGNGGLSPSDPLRTLTAALGKADVLNIMLERGGHYSNNFISISVNIIAYGEGTQPKVWKQGGSAIVATATPRVYTTNSTLKHSGIVWANQLDEYENPIQPTRVSSTALVGTTPNSYFVNGNAIEFHADYLPVLGADIYASWQNWGDNFFRTTENLTDITVYMDNICFPNGSVILSNNPGTRFIGNSCTFLSNTENLLAPYSSTSINTILNKCVSAYSIGDGFQYNIGAEASNNEIIEIDCVTYSNGLRSDGSSDQDSTAHGVVDILRVGGVYHSTEVLQSIADVGSGQSMILSCRSAKPSVAISGTRECWIADTPVSNLTNNSSESIHVADLPLSRFTTTGIPPGLLFGGTGEFDFVWS